MIIRKSIIVILALIGSTILFASIILLTGTITLFSRSPADFLPQEDTIALIHNVSQKEIDSLKKIIPSIPENYLIGEEKIVAIIKNKIEEIGFIEFTWRGFKAPKGKYWPYEVISTSKNTEEILTTRINSLSKLPAYRKFARKRRLKDPWIFVQTNSLSQSGTITQNLLKNLIFQNTEYISLLKNDSNEFVIETFGDSLTSHENIQKAFKETDENIISLSIFNPSVLFVSSVEQLDDNEETYLSSILRTKINKIFGSTISFNFHILPLFERNTLLTIENTASSKTVFAVSGETNSIKDLSTTIKKLHKGRRDALPSIELVNKRLDNRFAIKTLRSTPKKENEAESTYKNWKILEAEEANSSFFSAQKGNKFVLANNRDLLLKHINSSSERLNIEETKTLLRSTTQSMGKVNISNINKLMLNLLPREKGKDTLPSLPLVSGSILWSQEKRGPISVWKFWEE